MYFCASTVYNEIDLVMKEKDILTAVKQRMGIDALNDLQNRVLEAWKQQGDADLVLYSPTGTGKTLAFALCLLYSLQPPMGKLQAVVMAPSRELVMQIAEILRSLAQGYKVTPCYGGHAASDEKASLAVTPDVVVATPGRLLDHQRRGNIDLSGARFLVLDEMDKSLELGFEDDMRRLLGQMPRLRRRILASATVLEVVPDYVRLHQPHVINVLDNTHQPAERIDVWQVESDTRDKLDTLLQLLNSLDGGKTIVFVGFRESAERVHQALRQHGITAGLYHGALQQHERECAVAMLGNGSSRVLVATDLASRGLDIDKVEHIIHYHLPVNEQAYVHRNGRTARVDATGNAYVITVAGEPLPQYITIDKRFKFNPSGHFPEAPMATLYFQAGKKEKLSRGDILGFIAKGGGIDAASIGRIDVRDHYALAAVPRKMVNALLQSLQPLKIKGKKVKLSILK